MSPDTTLSIGDKELDPLRGGLLLLVLGVGIAGFGAYDYVQQSDAISNAVSVEATIVETDVESVAQRRGGPDYRPEVTFEYTYSRQSYTASNLYPATVTSDYDTRSAAESALEGYDEGETVTAYVNPGNPGNAFLTNQRSTGPLKLVAIGGVMATIAVISVFRGR